MNELQFGLVIMAVVMNKVTLCRARLVLRCVTIYQYITSVCNQPLRLTKHPTLSGKGNKYWSRDSRSALHWAGNCKSGFAQAEVTGSVI